MRKSGTVGSFLLSGLLVQVVFDLITKQPLMVEHYILTGCFFMLFRVMLDWTYWNNDIQKALLRQAIGMSINDYLAFSLVTGFAIAFINQGAYIRFSDAFMYAVVSVCFTVIFVEGVRKLNNKLYLILNTKRDLRLKTKGGFIHGKQQIN